jgi:hypothetical protein
MALCVCNNIQLEKALPAIILVGTGVLIGRTVAESSLILCVLWGFVGVAALGKLMLMPWTARLTRAAMRNALWMLITVVAVSFATSARGFYDPSMQRWINRDPVGEEGGSHLHGFTWNNPIATVVGGPNSRTWCSDDSPIEVERIVDKSSRECGAAFPSHGYEW